MVPERLTWPAPFAAALSLSLSRWLPRDIFPMISRYEDWVTGCRFLREVVRVSVAVAFEDSVVQLT